MIGIFAATVAAILFGWQIGAAVIVGVFIEAISPECKGECGHPEWHKGKQ